MQRISIALLFCFSFAVFAAADEMPSRQCAITPAASEMLQDPEEERACPPLTPFQAIGNTDHDAIRSNPGQAGVPVDVWNRCRYVDNSSSDKPLFVPFKSETEWFAFIGGYPEYVSLATCARPETKTILPSADCLDPSPASYAVNLPYARTGTVKSESRSFVCAEPTEGCPGWTQTAQVTYTALNADVNTPTWAAGTPTYGGSAPDPETCTIAGACGPAHGQAVVSAPSSGLCDAGDATAISGSGPWSWNCLGSNGGGDASCTAPISAQAGVCGAANGVQVSSAPTSGLCTTGTASEVTGSGPWAWSCVGIGEGEDASCSALAPAPMCNTWWANTGAKLPSNLARSKVAVLGDYVYLFGGADGTGGSVDIIYRAPASNPTSWVNTGAKLPTGLSNFPHAVIGDYIYIFGGYLNDTSTNKIYRAPVSNPTSWTYTGKTLPVDANWSPQAAAVAVLDNYVYIFGGFSKNTYLKSIYRAPIADPTNWTLLSATLPVGLSTSSVAVVGNYVYLFGGRVSNSQTTSAIYRAPVSNPTSWSDTGADLPIAFGNSNLAIIGNYIYLFGANTGPGNAIYRAPVSSPLSWTTTCATLPGNVVGFSNLAIVGDYVYLFGGLNGPEAYTNKIYRAPLAHYLE
jgi:N-acetylneuraminic acid mutarotase